MPVDDSFTKTLLHFNGTDASITFTDESGKTWTANGNAQIDTAQSVFGGASGLFDGTGDYLSSADHADWRLDDGSNSNKWTIDFRVRFNGDPGTAIHGFIEQRADSANLWALVLNSNVVYFQVRSSGSNIILPSFAWNPAGDTWYHIALVKDGTNGYMFFVDGTQVGTTQTDTDVIPDFAGTALIGIYSTSTNNYLNGWLDELRVSKGVARWTANFTPPSSEYAPATPNGFWWAF